jgi:hypothetical protein
MRNGTGLMGEAGPEAIMPLSRGPDGKLGVQARGGCACAGPYGHRLLGLGKAESDTAIAALERGEETSKPGWVRLNLSALMSDEKADFIIEAVDNLARVAPDYVDEYSVDTGTARFEANDLTEDSLAS